MSTGKPTSSGGVPADDSDLDALLVKNLLSSEVSAELDIAENDVERGAAPGFRASSSLLSLPEDDVRRADIPGSFQEPRPLGQRWPDFAVGLVALVGLFGMLASMMGFVVVGPAVTCIALGLSRYAYRHGTTWGLTFSAMIFLVLAMVFGHRYNERRALESQETAGYRWAKQAGIQDAADCVGPQGFANGCARWVEWQLSVSEPFEDQQEAGSAEGYE